MYSSGGDLHLDLPTGNSDASQKIWVCSFNIFFIFVVFHPFCRNFCKVCLDCYLYFAVNQNIIVMCFTSIHFTFLQYFEPPKLSYSYSLLLFGNFSAHAHFSTFFLEKTVKMIMRI